MARHVEVIKADHRQLARHLDAQRLRLQQSTVGQHIVAAQQGRGCWTRRQELAHAFASRLQVVSRLHKRLFG